MGKSDGGNTRQIKLQLKNSEMASKILTNAYQLRNFPKKIFLKPNKSLKEREEFQRLLKKKIELAETHPTGEGGRKKSCPRKRGC